LKRDNERVSGENYDLRKELDFTEGRNGDLSVQIRNAELRLREKEEALFATRRDVECQRVCQNQNSHNNADLLSQKDALEKHA